MTPLDALIALAVFMFVVIPLAVAVCALSRIRNANESDRLGAALWPDPTKTARGVAGKSYTAPRTYYGVSLDGWGETYTGGCGDQLYYVPDPAIDDEYDHHTLDALYGDDDTITETL